VRSFAKVALLLFVVAAAGCEPTPCDEALERIHEAKFTCANVPDTQREDYNMLCSEEDALALERQADCVEAAPCSAYDGSDPAAHRALSECIAGLTDPPIDETEDF
jgi:hypothetical protein